MHGFLIKGCAEFNDSANPREQDLDIHQHTSQSIPIINCVMILLTLVKTQYQELEKAAVCTGEYRFRSQFSYLEKPLSTWNKMSLEQRERHMKRVMRANMHSTHVADSDEQDREADSDGVIQSIYSSLSVPPNVPSESWKCVVAKAYPIAADSSSMSGVPGGNVRSRFVVLSRNPDSPQKVLAGKSAGQYTWNGDPRVINSSPN